MTLLVPHQASWVRLSAHGIADHLRSSKALAPGAARAERQVSLLHPEQIPDEHRRHDHVADAVEKKGARMWTARRTSMRSRTQRTIQNGMTRRQGFSRYCRNSCSRGLCSRGCIRRMGSIVTQPKMMDETVRGR